MEHFESSFRSDIFIEIIQVSKSRTPLGVKYNISRPDGAFSCSDFNASINMMPLRDQ